MIHAFSRRLLVAACIAGLAGCAAVGPDYRRPPLPAQVDVQPAAFVEGSSAVYASAPLPPRWWKLYKDPLLDRLVEEALRANTDLRIAAANLERSRAIVDEARAAFGVQTTAGADVSYAETSNLGNGSPKGGHAAFDAGFGIAYEIDVAGRIRRTIEAVEGDAGALAAAYDLARVSVAANVAGAYSQACATRARIDVARESIRLQADSLKITERGLRGGIYTPLEAARSRVLLAQLEAAVPPLESLHRSALYSLAALLGRAPRDYPPEVDACATSPAIGQSIPIGDGLSLIRRRPDIREAERRLAAATARIGVATADLYPSVSFGATLGTTSQTLGGLTHGSALRYNIGPLVSWRFPNTTAARARIAQSNAAAAAALAAFDGAVLTALRETETALGTYVRDLEENAKLRVARDESRQAVAMQRRLSGGGLSTGLELLDAQRTLASAQAALALSDSSIAMDRVKLFLALGGGWENE